MYFRDRGCVHTLLTLYVYATERKNRHRIYRCVACARCVLACDCVVLFLRRRRVSCVAKVRKGLALRWTETRASDQGRLLTLWSRPKS